MENETRTDAPGASNTGAAAGAAAAPEQEGARQLGSYRLIQCIGEGGMGEVWLADQQGPVRRKVAVKVIKAGMDTKQVIARFESERQALALMDHPAIARVFDGGSTPEGRPYFVMEYVSGIHLTDHCDTHKLSAAARLELLCQVCAGVQHAHQKAVIHRDLKPSNILISMVDGKAQPKIIDFGIAKATGQQLTDKTLHTAIGAIIGTPEYMSPEQAGGAGQDVDTRTDIYSLGVILYELLTGELPFGHEDLRSSSHEELRRKLREVEPPRPSVRVSNPGLQASETARNRSTEPAVLRSLLQGDLDAITMKALEKERARRYDTPSELAADLQRYLHREPVLAQPPSASYRLRKYVQRNKALVAGAAAVLVALVAGVIVSAWQAQRARLAERRAESEAATAKATSDFLQRDLLGQADVGQQSGNKPDPDIKVRTLLDRAAANLEGKFDGQPELDASLRSTIAESYLGLGLFAEARAQLERALSSSRKSLGAEHPQTLKILAGLARVASGQGKDAEAEALFREALESQRRVLGPEHPDTLQTLVGLGFACYRENKDQEARTALEQALEIQRRVLGPEHRETLRTMMFLANVHAVNDRQQQAEALYLQALEGQRRVLGPEHPDTLRTGYSLAVTWLNEARNAEAQALLEQIVPSYRRVLGAEHPQTLFSTQSLVEAYSAQGKLALAEDLSGQTLEVERRVLGVEHRGTLRGERDLAEIYLAQGRPALAGPLLSQVLEVERRVLGKEKRETLDTAVNLAKAWAAMGRYAQAEAMYNEVLEVRRRTQGPEERDTLSNTVSLAATVLLPRGEIAQAEALLTNVLAAERRKGMPADDLPAATLHHLARTWALQAKFAQAEELFTEALERERRLMGPDGVETMASMGALALALSWEGKLAEAEALFAQTLAARRRVLGAEHPDTLNTLADLAQVLVAEGKFAAAEPLAREAAAGDEKIRPEAWQRSFAESVLGASLLGQKRAAAAGPLLLAGQRGLTSHRQLVPAPDRFRLERAREWLAQLHSSPVQSARAAAER